MPTTRGQFKQEVLRVYNEINKRIFHSGVRQQKVDLIGNKVIIISANPRIPILKLVDSFNRSASGELDRVLQEHFKEEIKRSFEEHFHLKVIAVLKDYDVETEYSGTIVILEHDHERYLNEASEL